MSALLAPVVLGTFGLGSEVTSWYGSERNMQNAVDSAAIAAASNGASNYDVEAKAVALKYGYANGSGGVTVTAVNNQSCPGGGSNCYKVTITQVAPLLLAQLVGYQGDATVNGQSAKRITASATALQATAPRSYCVLALASSGASPAIRTNGNPNADLTGCNVMSNTDSTCNGHDLQADIGDAHGTNDGCGIARNSNVPTVADPYAFLAGSVPSVSCPSGYNFRPQKKNDPALPAVNQLSGARTLMVPMTICGDLQLTADTTINTASGGGVIVIKNGVLDLNGFRLQTSSGSGLTIIFTGSNSVSYEHFPLGNGILDFAAPTTGPLAGVAMFQDPALTVNVDISAAGNSPTWDITGLVYLPHAYVTLSGAVNKATNGKSCFVLVTDSLRFNGTGSILEHGQCAQAGLTMPTNPLPSRGKLVS